MRGKYPKVLPIIIPPQKNLRLDSSRGDTASLSCFKRVRPFRCVFVCNYLVVCPHQWGRSHQCGRSPNWQVCCGLSKDDRLGKLWLGNLAGRRAGKTLDVWALLFISSCEYWKGGSGWNSAQHQLQKLMWHVMTKNLSWPVFGSMLTSAMSSPGNPPPSISPSFPLSLSEPFPPSQRNNYAFFTLMLHISSMR